ncbi:hypothetical protein DT73_25885 [Mangrovibacter sp. MFB070]|uniref:DUF1330 domain-containing protein n=1 Tax=Mangrovibacter sp. MFB070 TaxID=1224318 RepID=UPI0004DB0234|nr:DUF1330 domain-containing protein [Mangrovibacter sp. MFB070]KEA49992.1 hypothetical protein DT73_25885 [Mangrovibacter sp. MFB070]
MKKTISCCMSIIVIFSQLIFSSSVLATEKKDSSKPAYYVAEFQLTDPEGIKPYSAKVESTFLPYSGRFIVRGGNMDVKEGFGAQGRLIIIKFDSLSQARAWYNSPEYQSIIPIRHRSGNTRTYIVEGMEP